MGDPGVPQRAFTKQPSISSFEQGLNIISVPPANEPITIYPGPSAMHANMPKAHLDLISRLKRLKDETESPPEGEIEQRLAKLKGLPDDYYKKPGVAFISSAIRTEHQQTEDLLAQMMGENKLQAMSQAVSQASDDELFRRLARIRGSEPSGPAEGAVAPLLDSPGMPPDLSELTDVAALLQQAEDEMKKGGVRPKQPIGKVCGASGLSSSSERERMSDSSDFDLTRRKVMTKRSVDRGDDSKMITTEEEEVSRIVEMYMSKANDRKHKKKKRQLKKKASAEDPTKLSSKGELKVSDSDTSELSDYTSSSDDEKMSACSS